LLDEYYTNVFVGAEVCSLMVAKVNEQANKTINQTCAWQQHNTPYMYIKKAEHYSRAVDYT
jgi:hypothetical protein